MRKLIIFISLLLATGAHAAAPNAFSVEGVLRDSTGKLQSMMVAVSVTLYDAQPTACPASPT